MNNAATRMTGIGCFAGGVTLGRVLRRMMEAYSLGDWRGTEGGRQTPSPALRALQRIVTGDKGFRDQENNALTDERIAGFFLNFENQRLNLSVFTRSRGRRCQKYTASLEELTRLRQSRLH
jgi:hypothetical protein